MHVQLLPSTRAIEAASVQGLGKGVLPQWTEREKQQDSTQTKNNNIMRKFVFLTFVALATIFAGCEKDGNEDNNGNNDNPSTSEKLVGSWIMSGEDYSIKLELNQGRWKMSDNDEVYEGTYTLDGDTLTMKVGDSLVNKSKVIMLYGYNVLVLRYHTPYGEGWSLSDEFALYYRENSTIAAKQTDIQGKWFWSLMGDENFIRCAMEFNGNTFDFIIPVWRERMKGTYEYTNGVISFRVTEFLVRELMDASREKLYSDWAAPEEGSGHETPAFGLNFNRPFVANGNEAYSVLANLPSYFEKQ